MRTFFQFSLIALFSIVLASVYAQPGGRNMDPAQRAEYQTRIMTDSLALSDAQSAKVGEVHLKYAQKMQEARANNPEGDWEAMRATMQTMRTEQDKELQAVLTQDQWQQWLKVRESLRAQRGGPEGRPGPGTPPPSDKAKGKDKSKKKGKQTPNNN